MQIDRYALSVFVQPSFATFGITASFGFVILALLGGLS